MRKILLVLLVLGCYWLKAQEYKGSSHFSWLDETGVLAQKHPLQFQEVSYWDDKTQLPVKEVELALPGFMVIDSIDVNLSFETSLITNDLQLDYLRAIDKGQINLLTKRVVCIRGDYFLKLIVLPIIYDELEQQFYRLESIQYDVSLPPIEASHLLKSQQAETGSSVLANGKWVKIKVSESGVHKIPYSMLSSWGFSDPAKVNVFGNGGNMLPRANREFRHEDLTENAVLHENNAIYFFAQGPIGWQYNEQHQFFDHQLHDYSDAAFYYLTDEHGTGKQAQQSDLVSGSYTHETNEFDSYQFYELENQNLLKSGREWYGLRYDPAQIRTYSFDFKNRVKSKDVKIKTNVIARADQTSYFKTTINSEEVQSISIPKVDYDNNEGAFANEGLNISSFKASNDVIALDLRYESEVPGSSGWLNYITLNARERLVVDDQLMFRNAEYVGELMATRFYLEGISSSMVLWDITDLTNPMTVTLQNYSGQQGFTYKTEALREFVVFDKSADLPQPEFEEMVANQDIRGMAVPEMLIVAHPLFEQEARRLAAIHAAHSGLQCEVVFPYQIYNEFSSGSPDVSAIRDCAKYFYEKDKRFKFLLLFGDGSYDNRTYDDSNTNFILSYQSDNSINVKYSYVSDDFFGCLDEGEGGNILYDKLDIGIGRFPVSDEEQAKVMVDKVENYLNNSESGPWKTEITFVGDDGDANLHMKQADTLSRQVYASYPAFNQRKIYFDAYPKLTTSSGDRYPEVNAAIKEAVEGGTLIFNYTGHGSERYLAHEIVLDIPTIKQFTNINRLPVFMTATCEFSRYDDYHNTSAGEWVVLSPLGGGVALFTTTRIAWSNSNLKINQEFYKYIFENDADGHRMRLGEVIMSTKNQLGSITNRLNFTLLGDPALQLIYPEGGIYTHSINGEETEEERDALKALTIATIEGEIKTESTSESLVTMQVFDKPITVKTLGNKGAVPFEYRVYQNRIFRGTQDVNGKHFQASFVVPKDIRYNVGKGRISYYSYDENGVEAFGADNSVLIGGVSDNPPDDSEGPDINAWLNDSTFVSGGLTGNQPILYARFADESGINTSGVGIGHDITLVIDENRSAPINLNGYYESDKNSFTSGSLSYQLPMLEEGMHTLELKAWDNLNNSSVERLDFEVHIGSRLNISETSVYPNPLQVGSTLYVSFEHDAPNRILDITCSLYTVGGRLVERFETTQAANGNSIRPVEWQPRQLQIGLYVLHCEIRSPENQLGKLSKKILVIR